MDEAIKNGVKIIPVDSEHSAIFQCLRGNENNKIVKIYLTASGGPFFKMKKHELKNVTAETALKHPKWRMGKKITIDSATLMNKGLEFIEAVHLFGVDPDIIKVLIHPQSVIHSMVEFEDGAMIAQLGAPDMRVPIQYALTYPERAPNDFSRLDFINNNLVFNDLQQSDIDKLFTGLEGVLSQLHLATIREIIWRRWDDVKKFRIA